MLNYDYGQARQAAEVEDEAIEFGELQIADYVVFLLAFDTYYRWMKETEQADTNPVFAKGLSLLRAVERQHLDRIADFLRAGVTSPGSLKMLEAAIRLPPTPGGASVRALKIRTILSKGGAQTAKHVFGSSTRARREVLDAIASAMLDDASAAFTKFAAIVLKDKRLEAWIDKAALATTKGPEAQPVVTSPVHEASKQVGEAQESLKEAKLSQDNESPAAEAQLAASAVQVAALDTVQAEATAAAAKTMAQAGQPDVPPARSEVVGIATAAAAAAVAAQAAQDVPPSLRPISDDPEKMRAVRTDGRVLVAAGAGSGKTTLLCSRIAYLVQEKHVDPSRIFAVVFNTKASSEISERLSQLVGDDVKSQMTQGTMHSIFRRFIMQYGTQEQKGALTTWFSGGRSDGDRKVPSRAPSPASMSGFMSRTWKACFKNDPPSGAATAIARWQMNNISPEEAKRDAIGPDEEKQATWYEWTLGFKRVTKNWKPPCATSNDEASKEANKHWMGWLNKIGEGYNQLGDFSDMITMFRDVLRDNLGARREIQGLFDHICVDEAQDLNITQHEIIDMISEQVTDGRDGKSLWLVGDEVQSVNRFIGAKPELFTQFHGKTDKSGAEWQTRYISTNYRCLPEIVETANQLMTSHPRGIPMEAKPDARKPRGKASVVVTRPESHAEGALKFVQEAAQQIEAGSEPSDFAVLTRTNKELNDFETAAIMLGVPYGRKGGTSFLKSPETQAVLGYMDLLTGTDFTSMQEALGQVINKPQRFFGMSPEEATRVVMTAVDARARRTGVSRQNVNPLDLLDRDGINEICKAAGIFEGWKVSKQQEVLSALGYQLRGIKEQIERSAQEGTPPDLSGKVSKYRTTDVIHDILAITGMAERGKPPVRLRDELLPVWMQEEAEEDAPEEEGAADKKPIGNVEFLLHMAQPTEMRQDIDPSDPVQFKAHLDQLTAKAKDLRVDMAAWDRDQRNAQPDPSKRLPPPCLTLSTVHSQKGAQYKNVVVVMPEGTFPMKPRKIPGEAALPPEKQIALAERRRQDYLTERQLAYVAMTRAKEDLTVMCPSTDRFGRPSRPSVFVGEAGLKLGENVPGHTEAVPSGLGIKTAGSPLQNVLVLFHTMSRSAAPSPIEASYDRRAQ